MTRSTVASPNATRAAHIDEAPSKPAISSAAHRKVRGGDHRPGLGEAGVDPIAAREAAGVSMFGQQFRVLLGQPVNHQGHDHGDRQGPGAELITAGGENGRRHDGPIDACGPPTPARTRRPRTTRLGEIRGVHAGPRPCRPCPCRLRPCGPCPCAPCLCAPCLCAPCGLCGSARRGALSRRTVRHLCPVARHTEDTSGSSRDRRHD